jgi:tellurite resistance protein
MGMSGLTITYQKAAQWLGFSHIIGLILMYITTIVFVVVSIIYLSKYSQYKSAVSKEFIHPVRINFFAAVSISMLMLAIIYKEINPTISAFFWYPGTLLHFYLTLHTISFWINRNQELSHSNPAWFIPIVGNILVPVGGIGFASTGVLMYFFSVGIFFWIILFAVILNRIIFHHQLAGKFMPTLFIFIAPPAIGFIAYVKMHGGDFDMFASFLYNLGLFFTFLLFFMYKNFVGLKFFISWWAFTFPLTAITIASMLAFKITHLVLYKYLAFIFMIVSTIVILLVAITTIKNMLKGKVCIQE